MAVKLYVKDLENLPQVSKLGLSPEDLRAQMTAAGMSKLAETAYRTQQASKHYELMGENELLYSSQFRINLELKDNEDFDTPEEVLDVIISALGSELFDKIVLWRNNDGETLVVGVLQFKHASRYFLVAQWGDHITTIEELRGHKARANRKQHLKDYRRGMSALAFVAVMSIGAGVFDQNWVILSPIGLVLWLGGTFIRRYKRSELTLALTFNIVMCLFAWCSAVDSINTYFHLS